MLDTPEKNLDDHVVATCAVVEVDVARKAERGALRSIPVRDDAVRRVRADHAEDGEDAGKLAQGCGERDLHRDPATAEAWVDLHAEDDAASVGLIVEQARCLPSS